MRWLNFTVLNTTLRQKQTNTNVQINLQNIWLNSTPRVIHCAKYYKGTETSFEFHDQRFFCLTKNYRQTQQDVADWWYLIELRKIFVRKLLATCTSVSDGIVRADTTSTILVLMGCEWLKEKRRRTCWHQMLTKEMTGPRIIYYQIICFVLYEAEIGDQSVWVTATVLHLLLY